MKTLIVNGSPHTERGTHVTLIEALERGLTKEGSEVVKRSVYSHDINPCLGCFSCWRGTPGVCSQRDDMDALLPLVGETDLLVLATPVYVDGMTGPMKTFLDRLIPLLMGRVEIRDGHIRHLVREGVKRGRVALISGSGFSELDNFDPLVAHVKAATKNLGREYAGEVLVPSAWYLGGSDDIRETVLGNIESAGAHLVTEGKIPGEISSQIHAMVSRDDVVEKLNVIYGRYE